MSHPTFPVVIAIEAAIGTGKSTLLKQLQERHSDWVIVQEPVQMWQSVGEGKHNLLDAFYADPHRYAFSFQTYCVLSRIQIVAKALEEAVKNNVPVVILERSWLSDRETFGEMLHKANKISPMEWELYQQWYGFAVKNSPVIHGHVYLEAKPDTCMARLRKRSRCEEVGVTDDYQRSLIDHHEAWLGSLAPETVCRVNVDKDFLNNSDNAEAVANTVGKFVGTLRRMK